MRYRRLYLEGHSYFITIVTYQRRPILVENINLLRMSFRRSLERFDYRIEEIVILPDHLHMIIHPKNSREYPAIIAAIKHHFSRLFPNDTKHILQSASRRRQRYRAIWQKRFYEHTIRNDEELRHYRNYIRYNPVKHGYTKTIDTWPYSSFGLMRAKPA